MAAFIVNQRRQYADRFEIWDYEKDNMTLPVGGPMYRFLGWNDPGGPCLAFLLESIWMRAALSSPGYSYAAFRDLNMKLVLICYAPTDLWQSILDNCDIEELRYFAIVGLAMNKDGHASVDARIQNMLVDSQVSSDLKVQLLKGLYHSPKRSSGRLIRSSWQALQSDDELLTMAAQALGRIGPGDDRQFLYDAAHDRQFDFETRMSFMWACTGNPMSSDIEEIEAFLGELKSDESKGRVIRVLEKYNHADAVSLIHSIAESDDYSPFVIASSLQALAWIYLSRPPKDLEMAMLDRDMLDRLRARAGEDARLLDAIDGVELQIDRFEKKWKKRSTAP
ncbi:MAG: HEAT repeat domain-containing protein [Phycisphaerae bacterium]|nr:HEAT repeat domain-containing protein [Phycisphaerales bacterium]